MSKLPCRCGYVIVDQTDFLPHKAEVLSDQDAERIWDGAAEAVAGFVAQRADGEPGRAWLAALLGTQPPADADDASAFFHILRREPSRLGRILYECAGCGRLWLQARPGENRWVSYSPDGPEARGILRSADESGDSSA